MRLATLIRAATIFALVMLLSGVSSAAGDSKLITQIKEEIAKVRTGATLDNRADAAEQLAELARKVNPKDIDDQTLAEIVSLLDSPDDAVRGGVAGALGYLGPRAKMAVLKLLELLPSVDCLHGDLSSAGAIRVALARIGVKPPPRECGTTKR